MSQLQSVNALGGFLSTASIDNEIRQRGTHSTYHEQMTLMAGSYGKHRSPSLLIDKLGRLASPMSTSGIGEADPVPETTAAIVQGTLTATEYANSVAWTERLETYAQFPVAQMVALALRQDQIEGLDKVAAAAYALGRIVYTPLTATNGSFSTTGTAGAIAGSNLTPSHLRDITDYMRIGSVPALSESAYFGIFHVDAIRGIKDSTEFLDISKYHQPEKIFNSEVGKIANIRCVEENNALISPAGTNAAGLAQATIFGADNVIQGVAQAAHLRYGIPLDFGRDRREGSFYNGGFVIVWRYDTDSGEEHQVRVDSL